MTSRWLWRLRQLTRRIWFRASLFSLLGVATALLGAWFGPLIPLELSDKIGSEAVDNILAILASSMLTVTTFSLTTMVSAYSAATSNVTPRANVLIMEDSTTQNVLSTFLGAFLFSLVGIIALSTDVYGSQGRVVLFFATILVIGFIVVTLLRWIDHLSRLGRVTETTQRVEDAAVKALRERRERPYLGCHPLLDRRRDIPGTALPVFADAVGYVQHIDVDSLAEAAKAGGGRIYVRRLPGELADPTEPLASLEGDAIDVDLVRDCFTIADRRSFEQDPRFGVCVLAEVASRALSPATNDVGTALDVVGRALRVLMVWTQPIEAEEMAHPDIFVPAISADDLFDDMFLTIGRDGATIVEVGARLQKALRTLARTGNADVARAALRHSRQALRRAETALTLEDDKQALRALASEVAEAAEATGR